MASSVATVSTKSAAAAAFTSSIRLVDAAGRNQIHALAQDGKAAEIQLLFSPEYAGPFKKSSPFNLPDHKGLTPLMLAAMGGHLETCRVLIACGAPVIWSDKESKTALDHAVAKNHVTVMQFLKAEMEKWTGAATTENSEESAAKTASAIKNSKGWGKSFSYEMHQARRDAVKDKTIRASLIEANLTEGELNDEGMTTLHRAVMGGSATKVSAALKEHQELLNQKNRLGNTPLLIAASLGKGEICKILIAAGADVSLTNHDGRNIFHEVLAGPHPEVMEQLPLKRVDLLNAQDEEGNTPLHVAAECKRAKQCELLLKSGATIIRNNLLQTPLDKAREVAAKDVALCLTTHIQEAIAKGTLAPDFATLAPKVQEKKPSNYVEEGPKEPVDEQGRTELHNAVLYSAENDKVKQLCLKKPHLLNRRTYAGETALMLTKGRYSGDHSQILLEAGAKIEGDEGEKNVLHLAAENGNEGLLLLVLRYQRVVGERLLLARDSDGNTPFLLAVFPEWYASVDTFSVCHFLLQLNRGCDAVNNRKDNALHRAVLAGNLKLVNLLLTQKKLMQKLLEGRNEEGHTPLRTAVETGNSVLCGTLLLAGATLHSTAIDGSTILDAVKKKKNEALTTLFTDWEKSAVLTKQTAAASASAAAQAPVDSKQQKEPSKVSAAATATAASAAAQAPVDSKQHKEPPKVSATSVTTQATAAIPLPAETVAALMALPDKHDALAKRQQEMEDQMASLATLNISALQALQTRANQFDHLFAADAQSAAAEAERQLIEAHPQTQIYYEYFCRVLTGTWLACQAIATGLIKNAEMNKADYLVKGIGTIGSCVPGLGGVAAVFTGIFEKWSDRDKLPAVQRIASLFPDLETAIKNLGKTARQLTLAQATAIKSLEAPKDRLGQIKGGLKDMKAFFVGDDAKGPLKQKAREDCERILNAIKEEKPHPKPSPEDLVQVIMGNDFVYKAAPQPPAQAPQSAVAPPAAVSKAVPESPITIIELMAQMEKMRQEHAEMARKLKELTPQTKPEESDVFVDGGQQAQLQQRAQTNAQKARGAFSPNGIAVITETTHILRTQTTIHAARLEEHGDTLDDLRERIKLLEAKTKK